MGAYQLLHLERVPAHAVLHDSVELVKQSRESGAAGMVNAVLRKVQRIADSGQRTGEQRSARASQAGRAGAALAERWAHPVWMVERWARRYGVEAAEAICRWDQEPAGVTLRLADLAASVEGIESEPAFFLSCARRLVRGDVGRSEARGPGAVRIQDEGSQLVAEIAVAAAGSAGKVLDTCAAPGGKTVILMERLPEAEITAMDVSRKRLEAMQRVLAARGHDAPGSGRTGGAAAAINLQWQVADAAKMQLQSEWDLILCDVPCSGTGTMARNPEIRLRITEADLQRQQARQTAILRAALRGLKPGGRLVYSTCSLEREENERVVEAVLRESPERQVVPVNGILDLLAERGIVTAEGHERLRTATEGDFLRTLPGVHPCDGFFAAVVERPRQRIADSG
jgi:16S rRNA (cytosine967-C5)-methyltransferase